MGEMTLREFLDFFKRHHNLVITMITHGSRMVYLPNSGHDNRMDLGMSEVISVVFKQKLDSGVKALVFSLCCNSIDGKDADVPYVRYVLPTQWNVVSTYVVPWADFIVI